ncbi:LuxR C-terminal-related transcriptional regulator [Janibacter cremeus]|uniref:helix-turn-helix domain-containing protein n=1 Tax=Janibacter cremeus TaxID=1285192 RepID=UPI0023F9D42C|nr:LuxR C-terminal-related transcriptional regulator [Janibacter cremeus]WEV78050.1 LuxR C-terminal-related transcriptional regulator [Janibacter cremeus]
MVTNSGGDPFATVVDLVTTVVEAPGTADARVGALSDLLIDRLGSSAGLMVHGAPLGYDVRAVGRSASPSARARMRADMRIDAGPDPLIDRFRAGSLEPTTAGRAYGGQGRWQSSPKCIGSMEIWGINQVAALPVRPGAEFVVFFIGRHGADYDEADLALLRAVQPVVAGLVRLFEPEHLPPKNLTDRETQVLRLLAAGHKAHTIARLAGCSERTVHRHLSNIYGKLRVGDRLSAVTRAHRMGLLDGGDGLATSRHG